MQLSTKYKPVHAKLSTRTAEATRVPHALRKKQLLMAPLNICTNFDTRRWFMKDGVCTFALTDGLSASDSSRRFVILVMPLHMEIFYFGFTLAKHLEIQNSNIWCGMSGNGPDWMHTCESQ